MHAQAVYLKRGNLFFLSSKQEADQHVQGKRADGRTVTVHTAAAALL